MLQRQTTVKDFTKQIINIKIKRAIIVREYVHSIQIYNAEGKHGVFSGLWPFPPFELHVAPAAALHTVMYKNTNTFMYTQQVYSRLSWIYLEKKKNFPRLINTSDWALMRSAQPPWLRAEERNWPWWLMIWNSCGLFKFYLKLFLSASDYVNLCISFLMVAQRSLEILSCKNISTNSGNEPPPQKELFLSSWISNSWELKVTRYKTYLQLLKRW